MECRDSSGGSTAGTGGSFGFLAGEDTRDVCGKCPDGMPFVFVPGSFGGGDIKFVAAVGVAIGVKLVVMGSAAAILLAGIYCIRLLAEKRNGQKTAFAFGLFLCMGMTAAMVFGDAWAAWFLSG